MAASRLNRFFKVLLVAFLVLSLAWAGFWYSRPEFVAFEPVRAAVPNSASSTFAEVDGVRVHYQEKGSGPVLVLVHGYGSSTYTWKDLFVPLSAKFRVIALDLKGFGFSTSNEDDDFTQATQVKLIVHLLDKLGIQKAILCGNSMGGGLSLRCATMFPDRVAGLILIDSAGMISSRRNAFAPSVTFWPFIGTGLAAVALTTDRLVRNGVTNSFYDTSKVGEERVATYYRPLKTRFGQRAARLTRVQADYSDLPEKIGRIAVPTLILWGREDALIPLESGERMAKTIPGAKLVVFDRIGHIPQEEAPELVLREILSFQPLAGK